MGSVPTCSPPAVVSALECMRLTRPPGRTKSRIATKLGKGFVPTITTRWSTRWPPSSSSVMICGRASWGMCGAFVGSEAYASAGFYSGGASGFPSGALHQIQMLRTPMPQTPSSALTQIASAEAAVLDLVLQMETGALPDSPLALDLRRLVALAILDDDELANELADYDAQRSKTLTEALENTRVPTDAHPGLRAFARSRAERMLAETQNESARALQAVLTACQNQIRGGLDTAVLKT